MPEQGPRVRIKNFDEVPLGFPPDLAKIEAQRCLQCKKPVCVAGCPVQIDIPAFLKLIAMGDFIGAAKKLKEKNALPAVCGRVCPQEEQCEQVCVLAKKRESVAIGQLERFAADFEREVGEVSIPEIAGPTGRKVAVVGSGPSGLTVAGDLLKMGHRVTLFEALHAPGGVLVYGIPEFRLPKAIVEAEISLLRRMGLDLVTNAVIGYIETIDDLLANGYSAVFVGTGAGLPYFLGVPGENLNGVYSANEYLTRLNLMKAYLFPEYDTPIAKSKKVAVIGGGNTAMDAARTALRLGPEKVYIIYRRSMAEMPARIEEVKHGQEEGIEFLLLTNPLRFIGDEHGRVRAVECQKMALGEPDQSGRRRPVPIKGQEFTLEVDTVVVATGNGVSTLITATTPELKTNDSGNIIVDAETGMTSKKGVFAGGDVVTGGATVILAMGCGRKSAVAIDKMLKG